MHSRADGPPGISLPARRGLMTIPLPLLVLPWALAIALWVAFPWVARRTGRPDLLRWLPPGLVVVGGALLWLSASGRPADGHHGQAAVFAASVAALCDARSALPDDRAAAVRAFQDGAHDALHTLAADPALDRGQAGDLLRAKESVESGIADGTPGAGLVDPMEAIIASTRTALADVGVQVEGCAP
jgi:hypothetical protein